MAVHEQSDSSSRITPSLTTKPSRWRRRLIYLAIAILACLLAIELVTRFYLGLTDPPLMVAHPQIEYLFRADQDCRIFRNRVRYNAYSMRAQDFPQRKSAKDELRVMVVGDSIINGGTQTDQSELATSILQRELATLVGRPVVVGNISAGGWGPPNELAYLREFGLFDADVVVIVLASHDYCDVPSFQPLIGVSREMPDRKPLTGTGQLWTRYLWPWLKWKFSSATPASADGTPAVEASAKPEEIARCIEAVRGMIGIVHERGARVLVAQYLTPAEVRAGRPDHGYELLRDAAIAAGADRVVELGPAFADALARQIDPYRDVMHPNAAGQRLIADVLKTQIRDLAQTRPATISAE